MTRLTIDNLSTKTFAPFTREDWMSYAGCESSMPLICSEEDGDYIIDGEYVSWYGFRDGNEEYEPIVKINEIS